MRRHYSPFNGKQFILNTNTGEIHDLDNESDSCKIENISPEHIHSGNSYMDMQIAAAILCPNCRANGCYYCLKSKDNG